MMLLAVVLSMARFAPHTSIASQFMKRRRSRLCAQTESYTSSFVVQIGFAYECFLAPHTSIASQFTR